MLDFVSDEGLDPRRLRRHAAHARVLLEARRPRRHDLERPRPGRRRPRREAVRLRGPRAHPRAHRDPGAAPRAAAGAPADQPAQRLSAHRHRRLHPARRHRLVEPACRYALVRHCRADLGPRALRDASDSPAGGVPEGRRVADRDRTHGARQDAGDLRLRPDRQGHRGVRPGVRHADPRVVERGLARAGARRRVRRRAEQAGVLRDRPTSSRCTCGSSTPPAASSAPPIWPA